MEANPDFLHAPTSQHYVCFYGSRRIAEGSLAEVALRAWHSLQTDTPKPTLTFNRHTGKVVDLNLSGSERDVVDRYAVVSDATPKRGRPKLGVVAREITLLPRHWEWLGRQPGGASVTLRKLVESARKTGAEEGAKRDRITSAYNFASAIAGNMPQFEEASRALFSFNFTSLEKCVADWPTDIRDELLAFIQERPSR